jgi:hypothetical protein
MTAIAGLARRRQRGSAIASRLMPRRLSAMTLVTELAVATAF